jgi:hypothetical protein
VTKAGKARSASYWIGAENRYQSPFSHLIFARVVGQDPLLSSLLAELELKNDLTTGFNISA